MKRPLIVLAVGFVLGEVLALQDHEAVFRATLWWTCAAAGVAGVWMYGILRKNPCDNDLGNNMQGRSAGKRALLLCLVLLFLGGTAGFGRGKWERSRLDQEAAAAGELAGVRLTLRGRIIWMEHGDGTVTMMIEDVRARAGNRAEELDRVIVYMDEAGLGISKEDSGIHASSGTQPELETQPALETQPLPGMTVELKGKLDVMEKPRNPGEFDFQSYYRSKGTVCRMFGEKLEVIEADFVPYQVFLLKFKTRCANILDTICTPEDSAIFKAVLLGDTSGMEPEVRTMYQRHGISHLLAVSGQHLAIIGGGIYLLIRRIGLGFGKAGALSAVLVISYGILTGSSGSAVRAVIMILCLWLAAKEGRSYDTLSALGLAALLLLWKSPYLLYQSGFQLSFGAVLSIGGLGNCLKTGFDVKQGYENTILISLCVQIVLTPVVLYHYYQHPLYGIFLNLLVIPLIAVLMYSGLLGIMLGSVWLTGGMAAVGAGHYVLSLYEWLCRQVEQLPGYCLVMGRPSWGQLGLYSTGMAVGLHVLIVWKQRNMRAMRQKKGEKYPKERGEQQKGRVEQQRAMWSKEKRVKDEHIFVNRIWSAPWFFLVMSGGLYGLCFLLLFPRHVKGLEVTVMDVGQGDGILMRTGNYTVLIDGGSSSDKSLGNRTMEPCLKSMGVTMIDFAVVSHGDNDHISGILYLLEESRDIKVRNLILPSPGKGQEVYERLEQAAELGGGRVHYMGPGEQIQAGNLRMTCLYAGGKYVKADDRNAHSLVVCADYGDFHMLFTGDMGTEQERGLLEAARVGGSLQQEHLSHVQVLKTAHHGSGTSTGEEFLEYLSPGLAVISYGRGNSYGHPSKEVIDRMKNRRIPVMETGIGGAVILWTDGKELICSYFP
ncbi:ComEC/Rec2 family competence protein [Enterocloster citroniae]|uniref:ComEC/Rec2 family competence protein n=1 Tax=Enterocloster citroniae TaxID=358743 RepID=UPI001D083866|nr:ComEC/Rec2 family competence protein [Enterocloster citroniae]MCB7063354.1 ComEC/Rec2 family competence protein [Enterocloster citroniae]